MKTPTCKYCKKPGHYKYQCYKAMWDSGMRPKTISKRVSATKKPKLYNVSSPRKYTRPTLIKHLDEVFSKYIRLKYSLQDGSCICYTCGKRYSWKIMDNAHWIKRGKLGTRWEEDNCRVCCRNCNRTLNGNYEIYTPKIKRELGPQKVARLEQLNKDYSKIPNIELERLIALYKVKVNSLLQKLTK